MMWLQFTKEWENYRELTINARLIKLIVIQQRFRKNAWNNAWRGGVPSEQWFQLIINDLDVKELFLV